MRTLFQILLHAQQDHETPVADMGFVVPPGMHSRAVMEYMLVSIFSYIYGVLQKRIPQCGKSG